MKFSYEIKKTFASVPADNGMSLEINLVRWNNAQPKYDIRKWDETHEKMSKGISLSEKEFIELMTQGQSIIDSITSNNSNESLPF